MGVLPGIDTRRGKSTPVKVSLSRHVEGPVVRPVDSVIRGGRVSYETGVEGPWVVFES